MLLIHRFSKFLVYALTMYMGLHKKNFQELWYQSKDIVNCVVNIVSSLGGGSSDAVELNLTNLHFSSSIVFIFYVSGNPLAPVPVCIRLCEHLLRETREL